MKLIEGLIHTDNNSLYTIRKGTGKPLIFLGGSNSDFRFRCAVIRSLLVDYFEVITYEPRGLGRTGKPEGEWTMADYAKDAIALLDTLNIEKAYFVGESFGAMTAAELAVSYPERVNGLCLIAGAAGGEGGKSYPIEEFLSMTVRERSIRALSLQDSQFVELLREKPMLAEKKVAERIAFDNAFQSCGGNRIGYPKLLAARAKHDVYGRLDRITAPTIVISGERDAQAMVSIGKAMADRIPHSEFVILPGGHTLAFETPLPSKIIIDRWIKDK